MKAARLIALIVLALALVPPVLVWLVPDQAVDPGAAGWLEYRHPAVPPERNLFYAMYGFEAPARQDPVAEGRRLAGEVNRDLERLLHAEQAPKSPEAGADIERAAGTASP